MQRAALCLVAVLVLLAGCSGGMGGGSDATLTAASPANGTGANSTLMITGAGTPPTVLEGNSVTLNVTVENIGDQPTTQKLAVTAGDTTLADRRVEVEPGETRQFSLSNPNTSALDSGTQTLVISTATDSIEHSLAVKSRDPLEQYVDAVRNRTLVVQNSRLVGPDYVQLTFASDENHIDEYRAGSAMPVPQAAAFEMANNSQAPEWVTLTLAGQIEEPRWQSTLSKSLAERYANQTLSPAEFRTELDENSIGYESQFDPRFYPEEFTYATGDRARKAYVEELARRLNDSKHGNLTVADYGLFNESISIPESTETLGPNASIYVEFEIPREEEQMDYRGFSSTDGGVRVFETIFKWGNLSHSGKHGEVPESVRLQFRNSDGQVHQTWDIPTGWAQKGAGGGVDGVVEVYKQVTFSSLGKHYNTP
ncbi:hypothetical protein [Salinibaculum rarum]|uniref:hypothetical protein n=1 Tax=Salinibaculum rarum TaxID=3058903 RepID=UPI00265EEC51|nr:hypothetical protein [Salinibaculum sp. KK48]